MIKLIHKNGHNSFCHFWYTFSHQNRHVVSHYGKWAQSFREFQTVRAEKPQKTRVLP